MTIASMEASAQEVPVSDNAEVEQHATSKTANQLRRIADRLDARAQQKALKKAEQGSAVSNDNLRDGSVADLEALFNLSGETSEVSSEQNSADKETKESAFSKARRLLSAVTRSAFGALRATGELAKTTGKNIGETTKDSYDNALKRRAERAEARAKARAEAAAKAEAEVKDPDAWTPDFAAADAYKKRRDDQAEAFDSYQENIDTTRAREEQEIAFDSYQTNFDATSSREALEKRQQEREARLAERKAEAEKRAEAAKAKREARRQKWNARREALTMAVSAGADRAKDTAQAVVQKADEKITQIDDAVRNTADRAVDKAQEAFTTVKRGGEWLKSRVDNMRAIGSAAVQGAIESGRAMRTTIKTNEKLGQ